MQRSLEFILGLLDRSFPAAVAWEDLSGEHGAALRLWQRKGFLATAPGLHPVPSCPSCGEGVPFSVGGWHLCSSCGSAVDRRHLLLWRFDLEAFLAWLARCLTLTGGIRPLDGQLWQLGNLAQGTLRVECFVARGWPLSERERQRLGAFHNALLLRPLPGEQSLPDFQGPCLSLLELLCQDRRSLRVTDLSRLLLRGGPVRFDEETGTLWAGDAWLGEVPIGVKEFHFLARLAQQQDRFVAYADIKHHVLRAAGSRDTTEEATFCQRLKSRIKKRVPKIDCLITTTNKGDGYRLRGWMEKV